MDWIINATLKSLKFKNTEVKTFVTPGNKDRENSNANFNTELHLSNSETEGAGPRVLNKEVSVLWRSWL